MSASYTTLAAVTCVVLAGTMAFRGRSDRTERSQANELRSNQEERGWRSGVTDPGEGILPSREDRSLVGQLYRQGFVTLVGQVESPGRLAYTKGMTLAEAIESVGGATPFGTMKRVRITRGAKRTEFNMDDPNRSEVAVLPGDVIGVPEKMIFGR